MTTDKNELTALSLVQEIKQCHEMTIEKTSEGLDWALRCGELLTQCKAGLGHGRLGGFVEQYLPFSERTARSYMKLHKDLQQLPKRQRSAVLKSADSVNALQKLLPSPTKSSGEEGKAKPAPEPAPESDSEPVESSGSQDEQAGPGESEPFVEPESSESDPDPFDEPETPKPAKGPKKPPKQYSNADLLKQWHNSIGPLLRQLDGLAKHLGELHSGWHKDAHAHLDDATEVVTERMNQNE